MTGAEYVDAEGRSERAEADVVVLAANAIGTARLLLLSAGASFPDGLANTSGLVGRRLMMHPFAVATGVFPEPLETWRGNVGSRIHSLQFYETDERRGFVRGAKWSLAPSTGGPMNAAMPARAGAAVWGPEHHERVRERFGHCLSWGIFGEDLPDDENRVTLDPALVDAAGVPAPRVTYTASENSRRLLDFHVERAQRVAARGRRAERRHADADAQRGLAPARDGAHGRRPGDLGRRPVGQGARRRQPLRRRRQRLRHRRRRQPDEHDLGPRPALRGRPGRAPLPPAGAGVTADALGEPLRGRLVRIADGLIPGTEAMPAPGSLDIGGRQLDVVLASRPDLADGVRRALEAAGDADDPIAWVGRLARDDPAAHDALVTAIVAGYYLHPEVQRRLGYPGQVADVVRADSYPGYVADGLLERVYERGAIYRATPG